MTEQACSVCKGERELTGVLIPHNAFRDDPSGQTWATVYCPNNCHRGKVPAAMTEQTGQVEQAPAEGDLAQWREEATKLVGHVEANLGQPDVRTTLNFLRGHLAAMPQPSVNQGLLEAESDRDFWKGRYQDQIILLEGLDPRMDGTEDLLKALRHSLRGHDRTATILYEHAPAADYHWLRSLHREVRKLEEEARDAIQQAEAQR